MEGENVTFKAGASGQTQARGSAPTSDLAKLFASKKMESATTDTWDNNNDSSWDQAQTSSWERGASWEGVSEGWEAVPDKVVVAPLSFSVTDVTPASGGGVGGSVDEASARKLKKALRQIDELKATRQLTSL